MLAAPSQILRLRRHATGIHHAPHTPVLNEALPQPYRRRHANKQRHKHHSAATPVRPRGAVPPVQHHAHGDEQIAKHFGVGCEHVCGEDVAEFAIGSLSDAAERDAAQDG